MLLGLHVLQMSGWLQLRQHWLLVLLLLRLRRLRYELVWRVHRGKLLS